MNADRAMAAACASVAAGPSATIAVHDDPDLDAMGAAAGLLDLIVQSGGSGRVAVRRGTEVPRCDWFLDPADLVAGGPAPGDTLFVVDTGSRERAALDLGGWTGTVINIDHHPDNTLFGDIDLVRAASSSTAEIVAEMAVALALTPSPRAAAALYTGILFDTGGFRHASTGPSTLRVAADLVAAGAQPEQLYREVFEDRSFADLQLWARAVAGAVPLADGRALLAVLDADDFAACAPAERTEGVVDSLRGVRGVEAAALVRPRRDAHGSRVSMRSSRVDVGALARAHGGGGHRLAAGFTSDETPREVAAWLSIELAGLLSTVSS